jgi:hypothetical protein
VEAAMGKVLRCCLDTRYSIHIPKSTTRCRCIGHWAASVVFAGASSFGEHFENFNHFWQKEAFQESRPAFSTCSHCR